MKRVLIIALIWLTLSGCMGKDVSEAKPITVAQVVPATPEPTAITTTIPPNTSIPFSTSTPAPLPKPTETLTPETIIAPDAFCKDMTEIPQIECEALVAIKMQNENYDNYYNWTPTTSPCTWGGVDCTDQHVTSL